MPLDVEETNKQKTVLKLIPSQDGEGVNLVADVKNHPNPERNRKFYLLRVLHSGEIKVFSENPSDIGLSVDSAGRIKFI